MTGIETSGEFVLNGNVRVLASDVTHYEWFNHNDIRLGDATDKAVEVGAYVEVVGTKVRKAVTASTVRIEDESDRKIHGFGLVDRVITDGPEPVFRGDGYFLKIERSTETTFSGGLKTLADVSPGTWMKYEGRRDSSGLLLASTAEFVPGKAGKIANPKTNLQGIVAPGQNLIDSDGGVHSIHAKYRMGQMGTICGWHLAPTDVGLQDRVIRVGSRLVPAFQKQMTDDERAKIHFRFYVVDESGVRSDFGCAAGLVLVPKQMADRLKSEDELAALLADGIAANLAFQSGKLVAAYYSLQGIELAGDFAGGFPPLGLAWLGAEGGASLAKRELDLHFMRERARMALGLMADAGYDPWQAPEAWRLMDPKKLPANTADLKYPNISGYQLAILAQQYKRGAPSANEANATGAKASTAQ